MLRERDLHARAGRPSDLSFARAAQRGRCLRRGAVVEIAYRGAPGPVDEKPVEGVSGAAADRRQSVEVDVTIESGIVARPGAAQSRPVHIAFKADDESAPELKVVAHRPADQTSVE